MKTIVLAQCPRCRRPTRTILDGARHDDHEAVRIAATQLCRFCVASLRWEPSRAFGGLPDESNHPQEETIW